VVAAVLFAAGWQNLHGQITLNAFAGFLTALLLAQQPLRNLSQLWPTASAGIAAADRIFAAIGCAAPHRQPPCSMSYSSGCCRGSCARRAQADAPVRDR